MLRLLLGVSIMQIQQAGLLVPVRSLSHLRVEDASPV